MAAVFALSIPVALIARSVAPYTWIALVPIRTFANARGRRSSAGRTHRALR
jgi:hypothetical protein